MSAHTHRSSIGGLGSQQSDQSEVWRKGQSPVANNVDTTLLSIILCITVYYMGMYSMSTAFKDFENVASGISLFTSY